MTTVDSLAPETAFLHIKDFTVERLPQGLGFQMTGRPAGRGMLDVPAILDRVRSCNPHVDETLEQWPPFAGSGEATASLEQDWARQGIAYLKDIWQ